MTAKLIPLSEWAAKTYGEHAPNVDTLRRWARESLIYPRPVKHGRTYFVAPDATYVQPFAPERPRRRRLVERLRVTAASQRA